MSKTLKDILADPKNYADALEYTVGDVKTTLGELRELSKAEQTRISKAETDLKAQQDQLEAAQRTLATNFSKLVEAGMVTVDKDGNFAFVEPQPRTADPANPPKGVNYDNDTYVGPVMKQVKEVAAAMKSVTDSMKAIQGELRGTRQLYETDRLRGQFSRYDDWPEGYDFNKAIAEAAAQKRHDEFGRLNLSSLHDDLSKPLRFSQKELDEQVEQRATALQNERNASLVPRPGQGRKAPAQGEPKNLDEAIAAAGQDPEILQGLAAIRPVQ